MALIWAAVAKWRDPAPAVEFIEWLLFVPNARSFVLALAAFEALLGAALILAPSGVRLRFVACAMFVAFAAVHGASIAMASQPGAESAPSCGCLGGAGQGVALPRWVWLTGCIVAAGLVAPRVGRAVTAPASQPEAPQ